MLLIIHQLEIEKEKIGQAADSFKQFERRMAARINRRMQTVLFARAQQRLEKLRLGSRLAAGKCHTAAGLIVKLHIPNHFPQNCVNICRVADLGLLSIGER